MRLFLVSLATVGSFCRRWLGGDKTGVSSDLFSEPNTKKGSNERLFILTGTHSMQIFGEIPFVKPQNDT